MERLELLEKWVKLHLPHESVTLTPASADASFRRYFRIGHNNNTWIVMDAPPQQEDCLPFIHVRDVFATAGVHVPKILAQDTTQGFLLLSDLGNTTYLQAISDNSDEADRLYRDAIDALIKIQLASKVGVLPGYDHALLLGELNLFPDWYIARHLQTELSVGQRATMQTVFDQIIRNNLLQPGVFVHRDYHSRNLMVTAPNPGVIDFQDAVYGPITYDLVSLFKDAYLRWEEERVLDWTIRYWEKARNAGLPVPMDFTNFYRDFEWMGVQRHLKVLGIFARLYHRDGKRNYLSDMPLVMEYLRNACERYRELHPLLKLLDVLMRIEPESNVGYTF